MSWKLTVCYTQNYSCFLTFIVCMACFLHPQSVLLFIFKMNLYWRHIIDSWFFWSSQILCLLIEVLSTFTLDIIIYQLRVRSSILPFGFHLSSLVCLFFFLFSFVAHALHSLRLTTYFRTPFYFLYWPFIFWWLS